MSDAKTLYGLHPIFTENANMAALLNWAADQLSKDPGHDLMHSLRVADNILSIDPKIPTRHAFAAALLHDVVNLPKDSPDRKKASILSAEVAARILTDHSFEPTEIGMICSAIETHSYSQGRTPENALGDALQDADRLEALGALGIMRTVSTGTQMGARFFHAEDPWAEERSYDDLKFTIDHFFTKLRGLPKTMRTEYGRAEAERRFQFMKGFLNQLATELTRPIPANSCE